MIPKFSSVQTKLIRTTEGQLVILFNLAMVIIPIITNALPAGTAAKLAAGVNVGTVLARQLAKGIGAWLNPLLATTPTTPVPVAKSEPLAAVKAAADKPTPPEQVVASPAFTPEQIAALKEALAGPTVA